LSTEKRDLLLSFKYWNLSVAEGTRGVKRFIFFNLMFLKFIVKRCKLLLGKIQVPFLIFTRTTILQSQLRNCDLVISLLIRYEL
jgi:hypothetical protein